MHDRPYMSIGDVLALLREEFPDITISKIRFLESRGLLVPERTPSGYRKFYDHDVDRLRWILRQQREHFLPLKVIKGRLEGNGPGSERQPLFEVGSGRAESEAVGEDDEAAEPGLGNGLHPELEPVGATAAHGLLGTAVRAGSAGGQLAGAPHLAAGGGRGGFVPGREAGDQRDEPAPRWGARTDTRVEAAGAAEGSPTAMATNESTTGPPASQEHEPAPPEGAAHTAAGSGGRSGAHATGSHARGSAGGGAAQGDAAEGGTATTAAVSTEATASSAPKPATRRRNRASEGADMTASEVSQLSGLAVAAVEELESYGLIEGRTVAGVHCYDKEALDVASLAAEFARFGIEARHLRIFKHAAERQSGLYTQVVLPILRQRNPEARQRAIDDLGRLSELGASLQSHFVREALRDVTGG